MALSKKLIKRRNVVRHEARVLMAGAAKRMNEAADKYNGMFQQKMSSKHHPDPRYRNLVSAMREELWDIYAKARATFFNRCRKYGVTPRPVGV